MKGFLDVCSDFLVHVQYMLTIIIIIINICINIYNNSKIVNMYLSARHYSKCIMWINT